MKNSKTVLSAFLTLTLLSSSGAAFADTKTDNKVEAKDKPSDSKSKVEQNDDFDINKYMSAAIEHSQLLKSKEKALKMAQQSKESAMDAMANIEFRYSKKDPFDYLRITELAPLDADYSLFLAEKELDVTDSSLRIDFYEQYINFLKLLDTIELQKKDLEIKEKKFVKVQYEFNQGNISKAAFEEESRNIQKARLQLDNSIINKDAAIVKINVNTNQPLLKEFSIYERPSIEKIMNEVNFDEYLQQALTNRIEIITAEKKLEIKNAQYEKVNKLFPDKKDEHNVDAKNYIDEAKLALDKAKLDVEIEVRDIFSNLDKKITSINNLEKKLNLAKFNYNDAEGKYKMGLITKEQLDDLNLILIQAENTVNNLKLDLFLYKMKMDNANGLGPALKY